MHYKRGRNTALVFSRVYNGVLSSAFLYLTNWFVVCISSAARIGRAFILGATANLHHQPIREMHNADKF